MLKKISIVTFSLLMSATLFATPRLSKKTYPRAVSAAAAAGAYQFTKKLVRDYGVINTRQVKTAKLSDPRWALYKVATRKLNPDTKKPIGTFNVQVVKGSKGYHYVQEKKPMLSIHLPVSTTSKSMKTAARASVAKATLKHSELSRWYAADGVQSADSIMGDLKTRLVKKEGKKAIFDVYHRSNGQDGFPMFETRVTVYKQNNGKWGRGRVGGFELNDIWE